MSTPRPVKWDDLRLDEFQRFLRDREASTEIVASDASFSYAKSDGTASVIRRKRSDRISWLGDSQRDYDGFLGNTIARDRRTRYLEAIKTSGDWVENGELDRISREEATAALTMLAVGRAAPLPDYGA